MVLLVLLGVVGVDGVGHVRGDQEGLPDGDPQHFIRGVETSENSADGLAHNWTACTLG